VPAALERSLGAFLSPSRGPGKVVEWQHKGSRGAR
jgi:hypothetical protein